jgi:hypothetical protein
MNSKLFSLLLRDTIRLIRPLPVTTFPPPAAQIDIDPTSHPHVNPILVLSDLSRVFEVSLSHRKDRTEQNHVTHKLMFYAAHILSTPSTYLYALVEEILQTALVYGETSDCVPVIPAMRKDHRALIEEI